MIAYFLYPLRRDFKRKLGHVDLSLHLAVVAILP